MSPLECWLLIGANLSWQVHYVIQRVRRTTSCALCACITIRRGGGMCVRCAVITRIEAV